MRNYQASFADPNPIELKKFYFEEVTKHHTMKRSSDEIHMRLLNIEGFDAAISILLSLYFNELKLVLMLIIMSFVSKNDAR